MITPWEVYWITRLDTINTVFFAMLVLSFCAWFLVPFFYAMALDCGLDTVKRLLTKVVIPIWIAFIIIGGFGKTFTPTTKEACAIYLIPKIANNEQVQKMPSNLAKLLNTKMEEWINDSIIKPKRSIDENTEANQDRGALD